MCSTNASVEAKQSDTERGIRITVIDAVVDSECAHLRLFLWVVPRAISKKTFALGEAIPAIIKVQGDSCYFIYKIRKLPMTGPDVVFDNVLADPSKVNEMNLNNLGDTLTAGNWEIFMQASQGPLAPGSVSCEIAPGQATQVTFTVTK